MRTPGLGSSLALVLLAGLMGSSLANATTYADLCGAVPSACEYTGPEAPLLEAVVCWSRSTPTPTLRLMTGASCPTGAWPYLAKYGFVDPLTLAVTAYRPLDDACSRPGLCQPGILAPTTTTADVICCLWGVCWPAEGDQCYGGELLYCYEGVTNEDGTVTCWESSNAP